MKVLKKVLFNSLSMILVSTSIFACLYGTLLYAAGLDTTNVRDNVLGEWRGIQYYRDGVKYVCARGYPVTVTFTDGSVTIVSQDLPAVDHSPCVWARKTVRFAFAEEDIAASMYFDDSGYLRMIINAWQLDLTLIQDSDNPGK